MIQEAQYDHLDPQNKQNNEGEADQQYEESYASINLESYQSYFDKINQALEQSSQLTNQMFSDQKFQESDVTYEEIYNKQNMEDKGIDEISKKLLEYQLFYGIQSPDIQQIQQQTTINEQNMSDQNTFQQNRFEQLSQEIANRIQERAFVTTDQSNQFNLHTIEEEDINEEDLSIDKKHKIKKIEVNNQQQLTESITEEHQNSNQQDQNSLVQNTSDQINQESSQQEEDDERHNPPIPIPQEEGHKPMIIVKGNKYLIQNYNSNHVQHEEQPRFYSQSNKQEIVFNLRQRENEEEEGEEELNQFQNLEQQINNQQLYGNQKEEEYEQDLNYHQQLQDHEQEDFVNRDSQQDDNENLQCDESQELENEQQYQLQKQAIEAFVQKQNQQQQAYKESLNKQLIAHAEQQSGMLQHIQEQGQENQQSKIEYQYDNKLTMEELSGKSYQSYRQIKNQKALNHPNSDRTITKQNKVRPQSPKNEEKLERLNKQQNLANQQKQVNKNHFLSPNSYSNYQKIDRFNQQEQLSHYQKNKSPISVSKNNKKINNQFTSQQKNEISSSPLASQNLSKKNVQQNEVESNQNCHNGNHIYEYNYEQNIQQEQDQQFNPNSYLSSYSQNQAQNLYDYQKSQSNQINHNQNYTNGQENEYYYEQKLQNNNNNKFQTLQKLQQEKLRLEKIKYKKLVQEQQEEREKKYIRQNKLINKEYSYNNSSNQITSISNQNEYFPTKMKTQQEYSTLNGNKYYQKNMLTEHQNNSAYLEQQSNYTYLNSFKMKKKQMSLSNLSNQSETQTQNMYQMQQLAAQSSNKNLSKIASPSGRRSDIIKSPQNNYNKDLFIQQNQQKNSTKNQQNSIRNEQNVVNIEVMKKIAQDIERQQALKQKRGQIDQNMQRETRVLIKNGLVADAINEIVLKTEKKSRSTSRTPSKNKKSAPTSKIISQKAKEQQMLRFQHAVVESTDNLKPKKSIQQTKNINNNYFANYFNESPIKKKSTPQKQSAKDTTGDRGILMILENFSKKNQVNAKDLKLNTSNQSITSRNQLTNKNSSNNSNNSMQLKTLLL
ncbi:hypothetical protein TTHERM_00659060 (macronuclear) [Tetrahymena thermophila SB210]|uniref:Uncharacterized protein n=1 Tax=Tetrahymena thermophila (strain SB210) TaxID=312017 RepID=I7MM30_TETTS|nr:hypothetical protein TTHERM_00659060 [Tetrahymena thermophila SB210]EAS03862.2 hypothetical protein TTHERM_00659060 [Tetrahymena thermophila SB210]|eukprot:XP_001024107.2 hypothetical protein TTHERM_00659060 [Tetrahymena thermophila SB210]